MVSEVAPVPWIQPVFISPGARLARLLIDSRFSGIFSEYNGDTANRALVFATPTRRYRRTRCQPGRTTVGTRRLTVARRRSLEPANARDNGSHLVSEVPSGNRGRANRVENAPYVSAPEPRFREINTSRARGVASSHIQ